LRSLIPDRYLYFTKHLPLCHQTKGREKRKRGRCQRSTGAPRTGPRHGWWPINQRGIRGFSNRRLISNHSSRVHVNCCITRVSQMQESRLGETLMCSLRRRRQSHAASILDHRLDLRSLHNSHESYCTPVEMLFGSDPQWPVPSSMKEAKRPQAS
jgi:hypothetical protein